MIELQLGNTSGGESRVELQADGSLYWPKRGTLFVADLHLGKSATFREAGMPLPRGITADDLERLSRRIAACGAESLWILGDFLHAREAQSDEIQETLHTWRRRHTELSIGLVRGNHDRSAGDPANALCIDVVNGPHAFGPFSLVHEPSNDAENERRSDGAIELAGHLHPYVRLKDRHRSGLRVPCFRFDGAQLLLPAYGVFTGGKAIEPGTRDRVFALLEDEVIELPVERLMRGAQRKRTAPSLRERWSARPVD